MRGLGNTLTACLLLAVLWPAWAQAVDISGFDSQDEVKKLTLTFTFSEKVDAQVVHNYAGNFVDIGIAGLKLPRDLTKQDHVPADEATTRFYRYTRFQAVDSEGHIRIYLGKYADPSDCQVVDLDGQIIVELVKPYYKLPPEEAAPVEPVLDDSEPAFIPDEVPEDQPAVVTETIPAETFSPPLGLRGEGPPPGEEPPPAAVVATTGITTEEAPEDTGSSSTVPAAVNPDQVSAEETPVATAPTGETYGITSLNDLRHETPTPTVDGAAASQPVRDIQPSPSYKAFDLDDVPVAQLQLRNMPFNEALLELTAGSGFNVVVGTEVSAELMTLDFRQKELSLKRALDLLCMAYDLSYIVEDDAIVIRSK